MAVAELELVLKEEGEGEGESTLVPVAVEDRVMVLAMVGVGVVDGHVEVVEDKDWVGAEEEDAVMVTVTVPGKVEDTVEEGEWWALLVPVSVLLREAVEVGLGEEGAEAVVDAEGVPEGEAREDPDCMATLGEVEGLEERDAVELGVEV